MVGYKIGDGEWEIRVITGVTIEQLIELVS